MWSKLSNALKRPGTPGLGPDDAEPSVHADVMAGVFEQHPNMSVFHQQPSEVPFPSPSPPASPSKHGRRGLLKRMSRNPFNDNDVVTSSPNPMKLTIGLPKKVKSSIQSLSNGSELSLNPQSADSAPRASQETTRPSIESARTPITPVAEGRFGSLRSILKPGNTPGTGQSVRFFSRDAYKFISSPEHSSSEMEDPSLLNRLQRTAPSRPRPSAQDLFSPTQGPPTPISPTGTDSLMIPVPPPDLTNIFDLSEEKELPTIPIGSNPPLLDSAIEISEADDNSSSADHTTGAGIDDLPERTATPIREIFALQQPTGRSSPGLHDRSQSFSFGQTVFYSMGAESSPASADAVKSSSKPKVVNRNRALSDTVFHSMIHSPFTALTDPKRPEADINDTSAAMVVYSSPEKEKDPFGAHATTYYTPGTMLPPSPPQSNHSRKNSREEDIIWSLRTQLALQSELCAQYEVDLSARDELVQALTTRASEAERECERRKGVARGWRRRVAELEKCVRGLEEEVERSRDESLDRSIMDEASGEALRMLHRRIGELERERLEGEKNEREVKEELDARVKELEGVREELRKRDESERELKAGIKAAKEEMESMGLQRQSIVPSEEQQEELRAVMEKNAQTTEAQEERHKIAMAAWDEDRAQLLSTNDSLLNEQIVLQSQLTDAREDIVCKEQEMAVLKTELEAQWKLTEKNSEEIERLTKERDGLKSEVEALNERISSMEVEWNESENRKVELENEIQDIIAVKEELGQERDELEGHLRAEQEHAEELTQALQEREDRGTMLTQERQYAMDSVTRLQENIRHRDAEIVDYTNRIMERESEVEQIREDMTKAKREHSRIVDEQSRTLSEVIAREVEARANMENMVREKAETDVMQSTLKERVNALKEEVERLRRQVHELQQESADKEVKLAQASKQRVKDKEDMQGLNIALDSKQQELELLKRRVSSRGTANNTPATAAKVPHRRESSIFGTPSVSRPPSVVSDHGGSSAEKRRASETPSTIGKSTLVRSVRANALNPPSSASKRIVEGSMGPPPMKRSSLLSSTSSTPTRIPSTSSTSSSLSRSSSVTPTVTPRPTARRASVSAETSRLRSSIASRESLKSASIGSVREQEEKENIESKTPSNKSARRMSATPA